MESPDALINTTTIPDVTTASMVADVGLPQEVFTKLVPALIGIITLVGLVGNSIVVYVIVCQGHLKTVTNYYIVNLAITDIFFLVFCAPFTASIYATPSWLFGTFMCKFVFYMMQVIMRCLFCVVGMGVTLFLCFPSPHCHVLT